MAISDQRWTPAELLEMLDREIATHLNGGYGPGKRNAMVASLRAALTTAKNAKPQSTGA